MNRAIVKVKPNRSSWLWLVFLVGLAIVFEVAAVRYRDLGTAVSGIGIAVLGAFAFLGAPSFNADVRTMLRASKNVDPKIAALGGVGVVLNIVGLAIKWLG